MIRFIDTNRDQFGVELICRVLMGVVRGFLTSRGYRAAKTRPVSDRQVRDTALVPEVARLHAENYKRVRGTEDACSPAPSGVGCWT
jgi:putative transposase